MVKKSCYQEKYQIPNQYLYLLPALDQVFPLEGIFVVLYFSAAPLLFTLHNT